ncbi:MAG: riboflavin synthase [Thioalkalivibrionaceae bacterium]
MFTGIVESLGEVARIEPVGGDVRLSIRAQNLELKQAVIGDSIAVNGVCLTATRFSADSFVADASRETLDLTTLGSLRVGDIVNLETALTLTKSLGGHLVAGHVDGVGRIESIRDDARSRRVRIRAPDALARYIAAKGSITIDGTSLTVNTVEGAAFDINVIPHTWDRTRFRVLQEGAAVNLEVDLLARYLERLLLGDAAATTGDHAAATGLKGEARSKMTEKWLEENGFSGKFKGWG